MSRPDKTVISIQIGKTTEEQVRFQYEKHLRTFIICSQLDPNASRPGLGTAGHSVTEREGNQAIWDSLEGLLTVSSLRVLPTLITCYFTCV